MVRVVTFKFKYKVAKRILLISKNVNLLSASIICILSAGVFIIGETAKIIISI